MHMLYATPIMRPCAEQVVCTSTLAIGGHTLAEHKAIVTRLSSIEELAGTLPSYHPCSSSLRSRSWQACYLVITPVVALFDRGAGRHGHALL